MKNKKWERGVWTARLYVLLAPKAEGAPVWRCLALEEERESERRRAHALPTYPMHSIVVSPHYPHPPPLPSAQVIFFYCGE